MKFSERHGIIKAKDTIQVDYIDDDLKNGLWNAIQVFYLDKVDSDYISNSRYKGFFINLWHNFFKLPLDTMDNWYGTTRLKIRGWFFEWEWYEIYDFIEFISSVESPSQSDKFIEFCNNLFEKELSGYRFINGIIAPITNELEVKEIDRAIINSTNNSLVGVKTHIENALRMISDRESPDYRNSIKESISAVESISKVLSTGARDSLGGALDKIKGKIKLHPALEKGFKQIYGYTSDTDGIRHALMEESTCDLEDAKYILVSCSAFINYLIVKADKAGIKLK
jgi:hypothetical protein